MCSSDLYEQSRPIGDAMRYLIFTISILSMGLFIYGTLDNEPLIILTGIAGILPSLMREDFCYQ